MAEAGTGDGAGARLERLGPGRYRLAGTLTLETVPRLAALPPPEPDGGVAELDLAGLDRIDSAGLALLVDWWRSLGGRGAALRLRRPPEQLRVLAEVAGLVGILPLEDSEGDRERGPGDKPLGQQVSS